MHTPPACADMIQLPPHDIEKTTRTGGFFYMVEMGGVACIFRRGGGALARSWYRAKNRGIHQCEHWFMHTPPACADMIQLPPWIK